MNLPNNTGFELYNLLRHQWFSERQAKLIVAQAAHESANFTSHIFKQNNNCFGMTFAGQEEADGELDGYAYYKSLKQCVKDYTNYYIRKKYLGTYITPETFVAALKLKNYFEAPEAEYLKGVKHFMHVYWNE